MCGMDYLTFTKNYVEYYFTSDNKYYSYITNKIDVVMDDIKLFISINNNELDYRDFKYNINIIKNIIIENLFDIVREMLSNIVIKYKINLFEIDKFIENLKELSDKYNMIGEYKKFISVLNI
jgi:CYTH domain-containing protein